MKGYILFGNTGFWDGKEEEEKVMGTQQKERRKRRVYFKNV